MSSDIYYNPNYESRISRQNSLPTYEEATGQVQQIVSTSSSPPIYTNDNINDLQSSHTVSVPNRPPNASPTFVVDNLHEHRPLNANGRPSYQSHTQPRFKDDERGLQQLAIVTHHTNPIVRQTAQIDLEECENTRKKARNNKFAECIGLAAVVFFGIVLIVAKLTTRIDKLSSDSTDWISQPHRHDWTD